MATSCRHFVALMLAPAHEISAQQLECRTGLDCPKLRTDLHEAIHLTGRTAIGLVDPQLPRSISNLKPKK